MHLSRKWILILAAVGAYLVVLFLHTPSKPEPPVVVPDADLRPVIGTANVLFRDFAIWERPNDASEIIGNLREHDTVAVTNYTKDGWTIVRFGKGRQRQGYALTRGLSPTKKHTIGR